MEDLAKLQTQNPEAFQALMDAAMNDENLDDVWSKLGKVTMPGDQKSVKVVPEPGFVIKTMAEDQKIFINVCGHEKVPKPGMMKKLNERGEEVEGLNIPVSIGSKRDDQDNKGETCLVVDTIFNADIVKDAFEDQAARDFLVTMALTHVEKKFDLGLDGENYKLPKLKYKGDKIEPQFVRDDSEKPTIAEVQDEVGPQQVIALGPPPEFRFPGQQNKDEWPRVDDHETSFVVECVVPRTGRNPWPTAKLAQNGYAISARVSGREQGKATLPYSTTGAKEIIFAETATEWILRIIFAVDTDFDSGPDPGSTQWRVNRAIDSGGEKVPEKEKKVPDYGVSPTPSIVSNVLPPKGATAVDMAFAASHAATMAASIAKDRATDDDVLPEDKFHNDDLVSKHYIKLREENEPPETKKSTKDVLDDDGVEYIDVDDYRPGGKYGPPLEEEIPVAPVPPTQRSVPEVLLNKGPAALAKSSQVWAELL